MSFQISQIFKNIFRHFQNCWGFYGVLKDLFVFFLRIVEILGLFEILKIFFGFFDIFLKTTEGTNKHPQDLPVCSTQGEYM